MHSVLRLTTLPILAALAACSAQQTTRTGFLDDPVRPRAVALVAEPEDPAILSFTASPERLLGYDTAVVDEVAFVAGPATPSRAERAVIDELRAAYRTALAEAFSARGFRVIDRSAPAGAIPGRTVRVRAAVTGFERANVPLNVLTTLIISPVTAGGAASEAEVLDAASGERLVAVAMHSNATPLLGGPQNYYLEYGHARAALRRHAGVLAAKLPVVGPMMQAPR